MKRIVAFGVIAATAALMLLSLTAQADSDAQPLTALSVEPGTPSEGHRPGTLSPAFSSSTYDYTVSVLQSDTHLTFHATAGTGYEKELQVLTSHLAGSIAASLVPGEFWTPHTDRGPSVPGHQVKLKYGDNKFRYVVSTNLSDEDATQHIYNVVITRPYPPLKVSSNSGRMEHSYPENHTTLIDKYGAYVEGREEVDQTWSLSGDDADDFSLIDDESAGRSQVLRFVEAPDYENPTDSNADNVYEVTIEVTEGDEKASLDITVTVEDVSDDEGVALPWLNAWDGSVDLPPLDTDVPLEITEGGSLTLTVRPGYAPGEVITIKYGEGGSGINSFAVTSDTSDSSRLARPETNSGRLYWSLEGSGWQAYQTITFTAPEDDDSSDDTVTLTFGDRNGVYDFDTLEFTVNIDDNDPIGGL